MLSSLSERVKNKHIIDFVKLDDNSLILNGTKCNVFTRSTLSNEEFSFIEFKSKYYEVLFWGRNLDKN